MNENAEVRYGESGVFVTKKQMKQIRDEFWHERFNIFGNGMIGIDDAYDIVCRYGKTMY